MLFIFLLAYADGVNTYIIPFSYLITLFTSPKVWSNVLGASFSSNSLEQATSIFIYVGVSLVVNAIVTIIFQIVGHAPETFVYQVITTLAVVVYLCYRLTTDNMYSANLFDLLIFAVFGIAIAAICILPTALVTRHILRKKRNA